MHTATILVRGARQLLTLRGPAGPRRGSQLQQLTIISDGSLLVRDGILVEVGPTRRVENLAAARRAVEVSAAGRVVMPGFVDSHTHLLFPPPGLSADPAGAARALRAMSAVHLKSQARSYLQTMVRHGTTTAEVKTGSGTDESAELKILRVGNELRREPLHLLSSAFFRADKADEAEVGTAWTWICEQFLPKLRRRHLAQFAELATPGDPADPKDVSRYFDLARQLGLPCKVHADQVSPSAALRLGIEKCALSIGHVEHATAADAELLGRAEPIVTLLPAASFHAATPFAPARTLIDAGAAVALATNFNPHHTPTPSMQTVVALACGFSA